MDRSFLIQLTNNLYKLTLLFPKKEPLRYKMREIAVDILANPNEADLETLDSFFEVAKSQNWLSQSNLLAVQREYDNLKEELKKEKTDQGATIILPAPAGTRKEEKEEGIFAQILPERQEKILAFLKENGRAQVWQIKEILPEVTKRTLRRDFDHLLRQGAVERIGERNDTFYQIKTSQT